MFEPEKGLWDRYILVMDYNSLYPSIIQEFDIDFSTIDWTADDVRPFHCSRRRDQWAESLIMELSRPRTSTRCRTVRLATASRRASSRSSLLRSSQDDEWSKA